MLNFVYAAIITICPYNSYNHGNVQCVPLDAPEDTAYYRTVDDCMVGISQTLPRAYVSAPDKIECVRTPYEGQKLATIQY